MKRLSGLDAVFLYTETSSTHMHVASTMVFDPSTVPGGFSFEKVRELTLSRLHLAPPYRRRVMEIPFELHHPIWIEDPDFDIDYHLRRAALPAPGGERELAEFAADQMSRPLDRRRPLWETYVIEGLENGMVATFSKTHHAAIDGVSGAEMTVNLLDLQPEPAEIEPDTEWKPDRVPTDLELVGYSMQSLWQRPIALVKAVRGTVESAITLRRRNAQTDLPAPPSLFSAPRSSLNTKITPHRRFAFTQISLDEVKMIKNALGGTVNDVVLAMCSGALRAYFEQRNEVVEGSLVAMCPISVRTEAQSGTMGNQVSQMMVSLHSDIADPVERLHAIGEGTKNAKEQHNAVGADAQMDWAEFAPPRVLSLAARVASRLADRTRPIANLTISNVPGPNFPLYSAGARMTAMYPMGPITDGSGLNITVMSYMGQMNFGLVACRETVPEVWSIAHGLDTALGELRKAVDERGPSQKKPTARTAKKAAPAAT